MKKNRGDEPIIIIIHIYMDMSQGYFLCSYLYLKKGKISFHSSFFYCFYKTGERKGRNILSGGRGEVGTSGSGEVCGERGWDGEYGANILYACI
jgi:hypothetical protein